MQINGRTDVNVEVSTKDLVSALKEEVYAALQLPNPRQGRVYIKDDRWVIEKSVHTTHAFEIEEDLGLAIEDDTEVFTAFHTLAEFLTD